MDKNLVRISYKFTDKGSTYVIRVKKESNPEWKTLQIYYRTICKLNPTYFILILKKVVN